MSEFEQVEFPCRNCGATLTWDPDADALTCAHCGAEQAVEAGDRLVQEYALAEAGAAARGYGTERRVADCRNCGARVSFEGAVTALSCVFCGSSNVLKQDANRNAIRPESLVPMDVGRRDVERAFHRWLKGLWFRPNALRKTRDFDAVGVYLPFWTFDCAVHSDWSAQSGTYYYVTVTKTRTVNGKTQTYTTQERRTRWRPAWGQRDDGYDDLLVNASHAVSESLVRELGGFDTRGLVPYRPEYLAGWRAEEYRRDLEQGWEDGERAVVESQRARCAGDVPGDTYRFLHVRNTIRDVRWKHVLLPLWSLTYEFGGKTYPILINGQTGHVAGKAPYSWVKITAVALAALAFIVLVLLVAGVWAGD